VVKFHPNPNKVSFLNYPTFDTEGHPGLKQAWVVDTQENTERLICYDDKTAPVLHRKELMVSPTYPHYALFWRLTRAEEQEGLLIKPPGTRNKWEAFLLDQGYWVQGHKLYKEVT
jgi:hypothetical protein